MRVAFPGVRKFNEKHVNPADEVMDVSSDEDVNEEIEDPERIKSASNALQVMHKAIRFSRQFDNKELCESIVKVISLKTRDHGWFYQYHDISSFSEIIVEVFGVCRTFPKIESDPETLLVYFTRVVKFSVLKLQCD